mmetsp:Transcript_49105/g.76576  ORF Transcript_49105/g.76576 Transcript_49105/m.76576 type:complete len:261 (+) Transcript_49105:690-1472(+)
MIHLMFHPVIILLFSLADVLLLRQGLYQLSVLCILNAYLIHSLGQRGISDLPLVQGNEAHHNQGPPEIHRSMRGLTCQVQHFIPGMASSHLLLPLFLFRRYLVILWFNFWLLFQHRAKVVEEKVVNDARSPNTLRLAGPGFDVGIPLAPFFYPEAVDLPEFLVCLLDQAIRCILAPSILGHLLHESQNVGPPDWQLERVLRQKQPHDLMNKLPLLLGAEVSLRIFASPSISLRILSLLFLLRVLLSSLLRAVALVRTLLR